MDTAIKKPTYRKKHDWRSNTVRGTKRMTMHKYAMETLGAGNVAAAVRRFFSLGNHNKTQIVHFEKNSCFGLDFKTQKEASWKEWRF